ncbi:MAG: SDR family NAD(P)-dependent oxidoreductase, partial [Acidilobaceae archaeon]
MDLGLRGKLALITGGSSGLGFASAFELALEGCDIILFSRDKSKLEVAKSSIREAANVSIDTFTGDLRVKSDIYKLFDYIRGNYGRLDILVYSTGGPKPGGFYDISDDDWDDTYRLLALSSIIVSREASKLMIPRRWGRIIFIGSITLVKPLENLATSNVMRT